MQEEWEKDRKGLPAMTFMAFFHAMFELLGVLLMIAHSCCAMRLTP